ncbi:MAG TPA: hypothetical protein VMM57_00155 [Bacteroidota bacterium]|nr:hypothetical protein [Bacteroidota bacterium]
MIGRILQVSLILIVLGSVSSFAQGQRMRMTPEQRTQTLQDSLGLSKAQRDSVLKIFEAADQERMAAFQANSGDRQANMETMRSINEKTDKEITALLTDEQKAKFEQMIKNRPQPGQGFRRRSTSN